MLTRLSSTLSVYQVSFAAMGFLLSRDTDTWFGALWPQQLLEQCRTMTSMETDWCDIRLSSVVCSNTFLSYRRELDVPLDASVLKLLELVGRDFFNNNEAQAPIFGHQMHRAMSPPWIFSMDL